jgi:predicted HTH transcriptional regulator
MTDAELTSLIAEGEGPYLEFKAAAVKPATLARTLVAFANTGGGRGERLAMSLSRIG